MRRASENKGQIFPPTILWGVPLRLRDPFADGLGEKELTVREPSTVESALT